MAATPCARMQQYFVWSCFRAKSSSPVYRLLLCRQLTVFQSRSCKNVRKFSKTSSTFADDHTLKEGKQAVSPNTSRFGMSFEEYVKNRRRVRNVKRMGGIPFAFTGIGINSLACVYMFPNMFDVAPEEIEPIFGLDPIMFCGLSGVVCAGIGYIVGGAIVGHLWNYFNKDLSQKLQKREADFLSRISKHRYVSVSKFEDDYYGEKIKTLGDYRQWLRTQQKRRTEAEKFEKKDNKSSDS